MIKITDKTLRGENLGLFRCVLTKLNAQYVKIYDGTFEIRGS